MSRLTGCFVAALGLSACTAAPGGNSAFLAESLALELVEARTALAASADSVRASFTADLRRELDSLGSERSARVATIAALEESRRQHLRGLPGAVSLDSLNSYYAARWNDPGFGETFETSAGNLGFTKSHFTFAYLPSTRDVAYIRIGRENDSFTSREAIRAWIREATEIKQLQGYTKVYLRSGSAEYGEYTEGLYRKGDSYFKTFFRYGRVQGTYGRYSLQYDYYIEIGSTARAEQYRLERYNNRLGSE
ncbi:MAG: hypothetical protein SFU84_07290 [Gemmatimonadales bacterium]|nr:hypothetical protein [Gemmatimonadales bacterium]